MSETFEGTVTTSTLDEGSKSERRAPLLSTPSGTLRLHMVGENPFEETSLSALIGRRIRVMGELRNGVVRVTGYEVLP